MRLKRTESRKGVDGIPGISKDQHLKLRAMAGEILVSRGQEGREREDLRSTQAEERREIHCFLCSVSSNRWIAYDGSSLERKKMKRESQMNCGPFSE